jgi:hypothetical protein
MSYARYKFNKAVQSLNEAGVRRREWLASDHAFRLLRMTMDDVPIELRHEFQLFLHEMTPILRSNDTELCRLRAIRSVDEATVRRIIDRIIYMHDVMELKTEKRQAELRA